MLLIGTRCQPSFQPAERDVRYALSETTVPLKQKVKGSTPKCQRNEISDSNGRWHEYSPEDYSHAKLYITDSRTSVSLDISFRWSSDITPMNFPALESQPKERIRSTTKSFFILQQCNLEWFLLWSPLFLCVSTSQWWQWPNKLHFRFLQTDQQHWGKFEMCFFKSIS